MAEIIHELRCPACRKLLGRAVGKLTLEIKCPRCRYLSTFNLDTRTMFTMQAVVTAQDRAGSTFV